MITFIIVLMDAWIVFQIFVACPSMPTGSILALQLFNWSFVHNRNESQTLSSVFVKNTLRAKVRAQFLGSNFILIRNRCVTPLGMQYTIVEWRCPPIYIFTMKSLLLLLDKLLRLLLFLFYFRIGTWDTMRRGNVWTANYFTASYNDGQNWPVSCFNFFTLFAIRNDSCTTIISKYALPRVWNNGVSPCEGPAWIALRPWGSNMGFIHGCPRGPLAVVPTVNF